MVENQIVPRGLDVPESIAQRVFDAMRHVPRHLFVPDQYQSAAYADRPLPIGSGQTISQPYIVALMTARLNIQPGDKVLEIGTGSGYQAAVLSEITPHVFSVEILEPLAEKARKRLSELGYEVITVRTGDGYYGFEEHVPFDGIIVTCAAGHIPPPLLKQLKKGGTMVVPIGGAFEVQRLTLVTKDEHGEIHTKALMPVRFVPMTGQISP
ncbi:MAG: protein-L-isoaspartate(D-aspartate) O-methyltransferase [Desulfovermiculus sp.]|nr:protein-L-isoaspartate(D-aspartate) O-methyltransferase [Desulfovermiculus sp.]